jgi:hypothetical protein
MKLKNLLIMKKNEYYKQFKISNIRVFFLKNTPSHLNFFQKSLKISKNLKNMKKNSAFCKIVNLEFQSFNVNPLCDRALQLINNIPIRCFVSGREPDFLVVSQKGIETEVVGHGDVLPGGGGQDLHHRGRELQGRGVQLVSLEETH